MTRYCYYDTIQSLANTLRGTHGDLDEYGCLTEDIDTRLYGIFQDCRRILEDRLLRGEDVDD